ncbi:MAG: NADH-quinone oxidoreductase subunit NuoF [Deltaproteobacteria bacterium]|nr:NADH-quinone oxidoreductase subunit NuoF [Deltaproteobacteria bacterium]MBN2670506.1 NADH-quinone oxidoreductase subunit NuoF [Deltaproteobacteria bacterium]
MTGLLNIINDERCTHTLDTPCPKFVDCLQGGPQCFDDADVTMAVSSWKGAMLRCSTEKPIIYIGTGTCGLGAGAGETLKAIRAYLSEKQHDVSVVQVGCVGACAVEPIVDIQMPGRTRVSFAEVTADKVPHLLDNVLNESLPTEVNAIFQWRSRDFESWNNVPFMEEESFFSGQKRWVLANCGVISPVKIEEYIARGGYASFAKVIREMTPDELCDEVEQSGLRGRGGGGFLTGRKWKLARANEADQKYMICNADEGDPGAFMDRAVIEGDPHCLVEGLAIASYGIGATKAYIYIRAEYPLAIEHLNIAIAQARENGLLGRNILDSGFSLDIIVKKGAGAFVCGEETALINSIEGKRGMPRPRPPYPAVSGLFGKPTIINNVETLANLPKLIKLGGSEFNKVGTSSSKGTKVFALSGKVKRTGLIEVEMGTSIRDIIFKIGGGIPGGYKFKGVQIGGPSGGCVPLEHLDIQIDYETLKTVGAMMGSGGLVVMDEKNCMVDVAKFFMDFIQRESCGKCIPCREGTRRMLEILERITSGRRGHEKVEALQRFKGITEMEKLARVIQDTSLCGLGQSAPNPVLSTLRWFRDEYEAHVYERRCPAGVCRELLTYTIDSEKCTGCMVCARKCPTDAIMGAKKTPHYIVPDKCIACGACYDACKKDAVIVS